MVEGSAERKKEPKEKLFNGTTLNVQEVHKRIASKVQDKARFEKKWKWAPKDADQFSGILTDWAKVMGASATHSWSVGRRRSLKALLVRKRATPTIPIGG
jgi:hypothetical protein